MTTSQYTTYMLQEIQNIKSSSFSETLNIKSSSFSETLNIKSSNFTNIESSNFSGGECDKTGI